MIRDYWFRNLEHRQDFRLIQVGGDKRFRFESAVPVYDPSPHSSTSTRTRAFPSRMKPSLFAASFDKSMMTPLERIAGVGPRSIIRTLTDLLFFRLVTRATVPNGNEG